MNLVTSFSFRFWATWRARCFSGHVDHFLVLEFKIPDSGSVTFSCQSFLLLDQDLPSDFQDSETLGISSRSFGGFGRMEDAPSELWGKILYPIPIPFPLPPFSCHYGQHSNDSFLLFSFKFCASSALDFAILPSAPLLRHFCDADYRPHWFLCPVISWVTLPSNQNVSFWAQREKRKFCWFILSILLVLYNVFLFHLKAFGKILWVPQGKMKSIKFLPLSQPVCWSHQRSLGHSRREKKGNQDPSVAGVTPQRGSSSQEGTGPRT
jgi:hypothetical protein